MFIYNNIVFITPNKVGSTSLEIFFKDKNFINQRFGHGASIPKEYSHLKKAILVRNPYERLASIIFVFQKRDKGLENFEEALIAILQERNHFKNFIMDKNVDILNYGEKEETDTINTFGQTKSVIENIIKKKDIIFLRNLGETYTLCNPDYILHIENIVKEISDLGIEVKSEFPIENITKKKRIFTLKEIFYNQNMLNIANEYFDCAKDAVRFGYKPILTLKDLD
jgi:hypothetical protein